MTINDDDVAPAPNPIDDAGFFVQQHYRDFLGRDADAPGLAFWTGQITACGGNASCIAAKRVDVSASFFLSIEFQETGGYALRTQRTAFGRQSDDPFTQYPYLPFMRSTAITSTPKWSRRSSPRLNTAAALAHRKNGD